MNDTGEGQGERPGRKKKVSVLLSQSSGVTQNQPRERERERKRERDSITCEMPFGKKFDHLDDSREKRRSSCEKIEDESDGDEVWQDSETTEDGGRHELESSLSSIDELVDFETFEPNDLVYREYDPVILADSTHYERFDRLGQYTWKTGRPSHKQSLLQSLVCTLQTTLIAGCLIGIVLTVVVCLDVNLSDLCYGYSNALSSIPSYVKKIRMVSDMTASITTQFWHLITMIFVFGFPLVKESRIISWNILAGLMAGIYKLLYGLFMDKVVFWRSFPSYAIFIFVATFNSLSISNTLKHAGIDHSSNLVLKLVSQFVIGLPVIFVFTSWVNPPYKSMNDLQKVVFASFIPLIIAIPKMILRKSTECLGKVNHPGTTFFLLMAFYTSVSLFLRTLQVQVYDTIPYFLLSVLYGALSAVERAVLPYIDFLQHKLLKGKKRTLTEFMTPRHNRLMSDLTLTSMIIEPSMIFVSCTAMAMLQFYYGHGKDGSVNDLTFLCIEASKRISIALAVEIIVNVISLTVESYSFNMPVMKVWRLKKTRILFTLLVNAIVAVLCFSHVIYNALSTNDFFDGKIICSPPFSRPVIKMNNTLY